MDKNIILKIVVLLSLLSLLACGSDSGGSPDGGATKNPPELEGVDPAANDSSVLAGAANSVGSYQLRTRATIGGNLCNASPCADTAPAVLALDVDTDAADGDPLRIDQCEGRGGMDGVAVLDQDAFSAPVAGPHCLDLRDCDVGFIDKQNKILGEVVD